MRTQSEGRPESTAREILKRRDKPFKAFQTLPAAHKTNGDKVYSSKPPPGYIYLHIGTPDLADRCRELSKERGVRMYLVHTTNTDEKRKLSRHLHRTGYHFKADIVEQACEELGYMPHGSKFVKTEEFKQALRNSEIAKTLARYNVPADILVNNEKDELVKVRSAIRELFPKIPEQELDKIVNHAWAPGSGRVGWADKPLYRRVQLAVIATIRHNHTDYDRLLRAFGWEEARKHCEQDCLNKLIEWRGENDDTENDDRLVEMVRETIVLDDDEEDHAEGNLSSGYPDGPDGSGSDTVKLKFISRQVGDDSDIEPEIVDDMNKKIRWRTANWTTRRDDTDATARAREMIQAAYKQRANLPATEHATPVYVPPNQRGELADEIEVNGQRYRRLDAAPVIHAPLPTAQPWLPQPSSHPEARVPSSKQEIGGDIRNIEQLSPASRALPKQPPYAQYHSKPSSGWMEEGRDSKRRRVDESWAPPRPSAIQHQRQPTTVPAQTQYSQYSTETPEFVSHPPTYPHAPTALKREAFAQAQTIDRGHQTTETRDSAPYDPEHPLLNANDYARRPSTGNATNLPVGAPKPPAFGVPWQSVPPGTPVHGAPAPVQQVQVVFRNPDGSYSMPARPQVRTRPQGRAGGVPVPVDGAIAPTQFWSPQPAPQPRSGPPGY